MSIETFTLSKSVKAKCQSLSKGVSCIYTVAEVAKMLDISRKTVYRYISENSVEFDREFVNVKVNDKGVKVKMITEKGLEYIKNKCFSRFDYVEDEPIKDNSNNELVSSLLDQLRQKDIQLAEKDKQIDMLMEQSKNYQVLLQGQQMLSLPEKKKSIFSRLFSRSEDE